jgi:hypothetical protein
MTEQTATFASNQTEAAIALGISEAEWQALRKQPGFPEKTDQGWDMPAINAWLDSDTDPATAQPPAGELPGEDVSDVESSDGSPQATAPDATDDADESPTLADHEDPRRFADLQPDPGIAAPPREQQLPDDEPVEIREVTITLPLAVPRKGTYIAGSRGRINTRLRSEQLPAYRSLHAGLRESNATYANGRPVDSAGDVLQWLFQQITEATADAPAPE